MGLIIDRCIIWSPLSIISLNMHWLWLLVFGCVSDFSLLLVSLLDSKEPRKSLLELLQCSDFCYGSLESRAPPPGFFRYISSSQLLEWIKEAKCVPFYPVTLQPKVGNNLVTALSWDPNDDDSMAFSKMGKELSSRCIHK